MKKIFSLFAAVLMAGSMMAANVLREAATANDTVFFVNAADWAAVKAYAWGGTGASMTWPGLDATKADYQLQGKDVYYFVAAPSAYANCIFNNGSGAQTADLVWADGAGKYYYNGSWMTRAELEAPVVVDMYIKHNWAGAGNWTWKQMTYDAETDTYLLREIYGATGCNWNTKADNAGQQWIASPTLVGNPAVGDSAVFALKNGEITITKIGEPSPEPTARFLKHNWGGAGDWTWKEMAREGETSTYTLRDIYGGTGCNWNVVGNDAGATWVASPTLEGEPAVGDSAVFSLTNGAITITKIESGSEPVITYALGASFNSWTAAATPFDGNTITVELEAGTHEFKVVKIVDGVEQWLGYDEIVNTECTQEGVTKNVEYGNIKVVLTASGSITVTIGEDGKACVSFEQGEEVRKSFTYHAGASVEAGAVFFLMTSAVEGATDATAKPTETIKMTKGEGDVFTAQVLDNTQSIYVVRCASGAESIDWNEGGNVWNGTTWVAYAAEYWFAGYNDWNILLSTTIPTDINNIEAGKVVKMIENGHVVIIREGVRYNAVGAKL